MNSITLEILKHPSEFEKVRQDWEALQWNPYYDIDYLIFKYKEIETDVEPYIIVIKSDGELKAIIAGEIKKTPIQFQIGYKRWHGPKLKTLVIHRYGVLGESNGEIWKIIERFTQELLIKKEIEAVLFRGHSLDSPVHKLYFPKLPKLCKLNKEIIQENWLIDCNGEFEEFKRRHPAFWKKVKERGNRIYRKYNGDVKIMKYEEEKDFLNIIQYTEAIANKTWQRKLGGPIFTSREIKNRYKFFIEKKLLQAYLLFINRNPSAFLLGIQYGNKFFVEVTGYDQNFKNEGIGTYLIGKTTEIYMRNNKIEYIIWGEGNSEAKRRYCDNFLRISDRYLIAPILRLIILNLFRVIFISLHLFLKNLLKRISIYYKIRSAWRYL